MGFLYIVIGINLPKNIIIKRKAEKQVYNLDFENALKLISEYSEISIEDIKSKSRVRKITDARKIYLTFCWEYLGRHSLSEIGATVNRTHATVLYSIETVPNILEKEYERFIDYIHSRSIDLRKKREINK